MAMNKKEQAEMDALRKELAIAKALRFTDKVKPDVPPPTGGGFSNGSMDLTRGWDAHACLSSYNSYRVEKACSSSVHHGTGWEKTSSQWPRHLYSTRLLALRACRNQLEELVARSLAEIDLDIEREIANPSEVWVEEGEKR